MEDRLAKIKGYNLTYYKVLIIYMVRQRIQSFILVQSKIFKAQSLLRVFALIGKPFEIITMLLSIKMGILRIIKKLEYY